MLKIQSLAYNKNLELAWRRITTGSNQQYKRYFRELYYAYELSLKENLKDLRVRLKSRIWKPRVPERIYLPKASGLQRPITLLYIEDQIVLQALANIIAKQLYQKRKPLMFKHVFSNVLEKPDSIYFFKSWRTTYAAFQRKVKAHYNSGLRWVADFDLAAFYDTISHELLLRTAYPLLHDTEEVLWIREWLKTWSSVSTRSSYGHGLPQGPIASDFLAECFLLPIDKALVDIPGYTRYVDDIRLFGKSEDEVRKYVIKLEIRCRQRGLIPQIGKFAIRKATSVTDALGMLPSIAAPRDSDSSPQLSQKDAISYLRSAISGKPLRIQDKARARYALFRGEPSSEMLKLVIILLPRHPEHIDAMAYHLSRYGYRRSICKTSLSIMDSSPYDHVKGELLHLISSFLYRKGAFSEDQKKNLIEYALKTIQRRDIGFSLKLAAGEVIAIAEGLDSKKYTNFLTFQNSALLQALVVPYLPEFSFRDDGPIPQFFRRSAFEPGLALIQKLLHFKIRPRDIGVDEKILPNQVKNSLLKLGITITRSRRIDPIGVIMRKRYEITYTDVWKNLFPTDYTHIAGLLAQADAAFFVGPSQWLSHQNSFNHALFIALQRHFQLNHIPGKVKTINKNGQLISFGVTLDRQNPFSRQYPDIADAFRHVNDRRNILPASHPYETRSLTRTIHLRTQERNQLVAELRVAYTQIVNLL